MTRFDVPDTVIGDRGRRVRCARCGHAWYHDPWRHDSITHDDEIPLEMDPVKTSGASSEVMLDNILDDDEETPSFAQPDSSKEAEEENDGADTFTDSVSKEPPGSQDDPFAKIAELMSSTAPDPIPDAFATPYAMTHHRRGGGVLWILGVILFLVVVVGTLWLEQDWVITHYPATAAYYESLNLRSSATGAGLAFRTYHADRLSQEGNESLVVEGIIENITNSKRNVPMLRLALWDNDVLVQQKFITPPQPSLDPRGSVGFRITLDQPNPSATRFDVTFTSAKPNSER